MTRMRRLVWLLVAVAVGAGTLAAQAPPPRPSFEVVSIRPNPNRDAQMRLDLSPTRLAWRATTLRGLIGLSYQRWAFDSREIVGGPGWTESERFDIIVQGTIPPVEAGGFPGQAFQMIRGMLADRFKLVVHEETRERPVYELTLARKDGRLGPRLVQSAVDCTAIMNDELKGKKPPVLPDGRRACAIGAPPGRFTSMGLTIQQMAAALQGQVGRPVIDKTGLAGAWDWDLEFAPEFLPGRAGEPPPAPVGTDKPSIFSAMQEQLGLRLESARGPVSVVVVDRAERPTEN